MIQLRACGADEGVAGEIVQHHLSYSRPATARTRLRLGRPQRHVDIALHLIRGLIRAQVNTTRLRRPVPLNPMFNSSKRRTASVLFSTTTTYPTCG